MQVGTGNLLPPINGTYNFFLVKKKKVKHKAATFKFICGKKGNTKLYLTLDVL